MSELNSIGWMMVKWMIPVSIATLFFFAILTNISLFARVVRVESLTSSIHPPSSRPNTYIYIIRYDLE